MQSLQKFVTAASQRASTPFTGLFASTRLFSTAPLSLNTIRDNPGARKKEKRVGRGIGSGLGKTATRGHKGATSRKGYYMKPYFEGGQVNLVKRFPKHGFINYNARELMAINLGQIMVMVNEGRIDPTKTITMKTLVDCRLVNRRSIEDGVKLLATGKEKVDIPLSFEMSDVSESAKKTVEAAGGKVHLVYYNKLGLRVHLTPEKFHPALTPRTDVLPPPRLIPKYAPYHPWMQNTLKGKGMDYAVKRYQP